MPLEQVILVDTNDHPIGTIEKLEAHQKGLLHRAFSIFIFNAQGKLLLQQRAFTKYHSAGLWTNTCCSHPRPDETNENAAIRRLKEEMGIETALNYKGAFIYKAEFDNELIEHEFDHVFVGTFNDNPIINIDEVNNYDWKTLDEIKKDISINPNNYTAWLKIALEKLF